MITDDLSGTSTGFAAACSSRSSKVSSLRCGSTERDIFSASTQPGRISSGVTVRASSTLASTDFVVGRSTAADSVRVATSINPISSTLPITPLSRRTITSSGVESICITSPGADTVNSPNGAFAPWAFERRVTAEPVAWVPFVSLASSR
ncbi:hypothetical protein OG749_42695 [Streptomyces nojiriensis]|uniref:hypothetical protein n=1 Tax=Streptomyces nojiriensis TaxID=66374 RepID=UPI002E17EF0F